MFSPVLLKITIFLFDSSTKEFNPAHLTRGNFEKLKSELDKCIVLCANCHRREHANIGV